jgi:transcriptional regulator with XRE-family HTH domain
LTVADRDLTPSEREHLRALVKEERDRLKLTQQKLGDLAGVDQSVISNIERRGGVSHVKASKILFALGYEKDPLLDSGRRVRRVSVRTDASYKEIRAKLRVLENDETLDMATDVLDKLKSPLSEAGFRDAVWIVKRAVERGLSTKPTGLADTIGSDMIATKSGVDVVKGKTKGGE